MFRPAIIRLPIAHAKKNNRKVHFVFIFFGTPPGKVLYYLQAQNVLLSLRIIHHSAGALFLGRATGEGSD